MLERYIKQVLAIDESIHASAFRAVLDFLNSQTNLVKVPNYFKYSIYNKVIKEIKAKPDIANLSDIY